MYEDLLDVKTLLMKITVEGSSQSQLPPGHGLLTVPEKKFYFVEQD